MPKVSSESAPHVDDFGIAEDRHDELGGYTVNFVTIRERVDITPWLRGCPTTCASARTGDTCSRAG